MKVFAVSLYRRHIFNTPPHEPSITGSVKPWPIVMQQKQAHHVTDGLGSEEYKLSATGPLHLETKVDQRTHRW